VFFAAHHHPPPRAMSACPASGSPERQFSRAATCKKISAHGTAAKTLHRRARRTAAPDWSLPPRFWVSLKSAVARDRWPRFAIRPQAMIFPSMGSLVRRYLIALLDAGIQGRNPGMLSGQRRLSDLTDARQVVPAPDPRRTVAPQLQSRAGVISAWARGRRSPCAMRNCHSTRSMPVMSSVTGLFHLQSSIHFHEVEVLSIVDQEFEPCLRRCKPTALCGFDRGQRHRRTYLGRVGPAAGASSMIF